MPQTIEEDIPGKDIAAGILITLLIFAVTLFIPIIGFFCSVFIPLPVFLYRSKLGRANGAVVAIVSFILIGIGLGIGFDLFFFTGLLLIGFVLGELVSMNLSLEKTASFACAMVMGAGFACLFVYSHSTRTDLTLMVSDYIGKNLEHAMGLYKDMRISEEIIFTISSQLENIRYVLVRIIPGMAAAFCLFVIWITLIMARPIMKKAELFYPDFGALSLWKPPELLVWAAIGCGAVILFPIPDKTIKFIALNGVIILMTIYFFAGLAVISFYFEKKQFPPMLRFFLYSLIALQQIVLLFVIGLGFFDLWLNFRKLETE